MCLNAHCRVKFLCADIRYGFLRLSTIRKCPHMLRSDHRGLRNGDLKLMWWWVVGVQGKWHNSFNPAYCLLPTAQLSASKYSLLQSYSFYKELKI